MKTLINASALGLLSLVGAISPDTSLFLWGADPQSLVASVVKADASSTVYLINCPKGTPNDECGTFDQTLVQGDDFYEATLTMADFTDFWSCSLKGTTSASCSQSVFGASANDPGVHSATFSGNDMPYLPVTITAGLAKLSAGATGSSGPASTTASSTATTAASGYVSIAFPDYNPTGLALSVITAAPSSTVYQVGCARGVDCPFQGGYLPTLTAGESSVGVGISTSRNLVTFRCTGTSLSRCWRSTSLVEDGTTRTGTATDVRVTFGAASVTGGQEKLASASASASAASASSRSASSTSTGAAPQVTGRSGGLLAAAAMGLAGAAVLV